MADVSAMCFVTYTHEWRVSTVLLQHLRKMYRCAIISYLNNFYTTDLVKEVKDNNSIEKEWALTTNVRLDMIEGFYIIFKRYICAYVQVLRKCCSKTVPWQLTVEQNLQEMTSWRYYAYVSREIETHQRLSLFPRTTFTA